MPTLTVDLGSGAASDDVYLIVYEDDTYAACWDGDSWEIPNAGSFDSGGVAGVHQGDGIFTFEFPASITTPGVYPVRVFEYPGVVGSYAPDDPQLTYDIDANSVTITGVIPVTSHAIPYDVANPSAVPYGEVVAIAVNEGRDWVFSPVTLPDSPTSAADWSVVFTGFGLASPIIYADNSGDFSTVVDVNAWTITAPVESDGDTGQLSGIVPGTWGTVDLVYQPEGSDRAIMRRIPARVVR